MTTYLADGNVLVALTVIEHVHNVVATEWFDNEQPDLATCPITEGTLLRFLLRAGASAIDSMEVLDLIRGEDWHHFWADDIPFEKAHLAGVIGHRQVTDAYLVALARKHNARLVTFDRGLAALHPKQVHLLGS